MDERIRERMRTLLEELHATERHSTEYYRTVEELEALIAEPTPKDRAWLKLVEVINLGEVTHYAFETEEARDAFRAAAEVLGKSVIDEALFRNTMQADDGYWYLTIMGEGAE